MAYVRDAKQYLQRDPYDWFKFIMKHHKRNNGKTTPFHQESLL